MRISTAKGTLDLRGTVNMRTMWSLGCTDKGREGSGTEVENAAAQ